MEKDNNAMVDAKDDYDDVDLVLPLIEDVIYDIDVISIVKIREKIFNEFVKDEYYIKFDVLKNLKGYISGKEVVRVSEVWCRDDLCCLLNEEICIICMKESVIPGEDFYLMGNAGYIPVLLNKEGVISKIILLLLNSNNCEYVFSGNLIIDSFIIDSIEYHTSTKVKVCKDSVVINYDYFLYMLDNYVFNAQNK